MSATVTTNSLSKLAGMGTTTNELRAIKPPLEIPSGWAWLVWVLGGLALAAALFLAWKYWRRKREEAPPVPVIPPHVRARQRLEEALGLIATPRPFCIMVSDTIRVYLEERFDFHAPERTTEEFLYELKSTNRLTPDQKTSLGEFLERCDLVKFARYEPAEPELRELHGSGVRLVDETEPLPAPVASEVQPTAGAASPSTK